MQLPQSTRPRPNFDPRYARLCNLYWDAFLLGARDFPKHDVALTLPRLYPSGASHQAR
jgi:hypothetical protein